MNYKICPHYNEMVNVLAEGKELDDISFKLEDIEGCDECGKDEKGEPITVADTITQKSYTLVDLMARYEFDKHLSATLNVKNRFDQKYYDNVGFYNGVFWGDPRTVNLGIEWKL